MASSSNLIQAMNDIILDNEEEGGLLIKKIEEVDKSYIFNEFDVKLCFVSRFIAEGASNFLVIYHI